MKKGLSLIFVMTLCTIFSYAHATLITYNMDRGIDTEGYNFSGFVNIDSDPSIYFDPDPSQGGVISYTIAQYEFLSYEGRAYGESGQITLFITPSDYVLTEGGNILFNHTDIVNDVGKLNSSHWDNDFSGVEFVGVEPTVAAYSFLPQEIRIYSDFMAGQGYWGPGYPLITLERTPQPVPEPSTMLLIGSGLLGFVGFRKKMKG